MNHIDPPYERLLFVCTLARMRSKTAAALCKIADNETLYCGTAPDADIPVTKELLDWADVVVLMENCHRSKIRRKWSGYSHKMLVWGIPDEYCYMDDTLCHIINRKKPYLIGGDV